MGKREIYHEFVDPKIEGTPFSAEEDEMVICGGYTTQNLALVLGRSTKAILARIQKIKSYKSKGGLEALREKEEKEQQQQTLDFDKEHKVGTKRYFTPLEDLIVLDEELTMKERAKELGRTVDSVGGRFRRLTRPQIEGAYKEKRKENKENKGQWTDAEDKIALNTRYSVQYRAEKLGRPIESVISRVSLYKLLRKEYSKESQTKRVDANREKYNKNARKHATFNKDAKNSRKPWTPEQDKIALDPNLTGKEKALKLDRSLIAIRKRCLKLRNAK